MRLKVFDLIDETLELLEANRSFYESCEAEIKSAFMAILLPDEEYVVEFNSRVKSAESLREKIIRNRFYQHHDNAISVLTHLSDLVGVSIECRFIEEEHKVLQRLRSVLLQQNPDGFCYCEQIPQLHLACMQHQPQVQKNGFSIYRMDGYYEKEGRKVNFELQIKSLVHAFWGEIEHKLVYKNMGYYVYDSFMKELLASINAQLAITDRQLSIVYKQMQQLSQSNSGLNERTFEKQCSKAINDLFAKKMHESLGFNLNIKHTSSILGHYIFIKDLQFEGANNDRISALFQTFRKLNYIAIDFENEIAIPNSFVSNDIFIQTLGNYLFSVLNEDYDWFVFFKMLFAVEPGNDIQDFSLFLSVIKNYLVDNYWFHTSFVKLPFAEATQLHEECSYLLAQSLCEIGTIQIIYDEHMRAINQEFVHFIEELEQRVLSYRDFMQYREGYYGDWMQRLRRIFQMQ